MQEDLDIAAVASRVLGEEIAGVVGPERMSEIAERWSQSRKDLLYHYMAVTNALDWTGSADRRRALIQAVERGIGIRSAG